MAKQKLFAVLKYAFGILAASFILEFLDLSQPSSTDTLQHLLTYTFWGKLAGLFVVYLIAAYLLVFFTDKSRSEVTEE